MEQQVDGPCPDCGDDYIYAIDEGKTGVLYVHGFTYFGELDDLVKEGCHVSEASFRHQEPSVEREMEEAEFFLDVVSDTTFRGYTSGDTWNGWACPLFPKPEADRIAETFDGFKDPYTGEEHRAAYDEEADAFVFYDPADDHWSAFRGVDLEGTTLYPIGTYAWTWREADL
jgi:hypothetical protein